MYIEICENTLLNTVLHVKINLNCDQSCLKINFPLKSTSYYYWLLITVDFQSPLVKSQQKVQQQAIFKIVDVLFS